jgi:hypothetical protein
VDKYHRFEGTGKPAFLSLSDFAGFNNAANRAFSINVAGNSTYLDRY